MGELSIGNLMFKSSKTSTKLHPRLIMGLKGTAVISARLVGKDKWDKINIVDNVSWRKVENFVKIC